MIVMLITIYYCSKTLSLFAEKSDLKQTFGNLIMDVTQNKHVTVNPTVEADVVFSF